MTNLIYYGEKSELRDFSSSEEQALKNIENSIGIFDFKGNANELASRARKLPDIEHLNSRVMAAVLVLRQRKNGDQSMLMINNYEKVEKKLLDLSKKNTDKIKKKMEIRATLTRYYKALEMSNAFD